MTVSKTIARALLLFSLWAGPALAQSEPPMQFARSVLAIETADGARHRFEVEVASDDDQRARGLMFRETLGPDAGMIFVYPRPQQVAMWMRNTLIPLDMLFVAADGRIRNIARMTVPYSLKPVASVGRVLAVIELAGGSADRLGLRPGDRVLHATFGTGSP